MIHPYQCCDLRFLSCYLTKKDLALSVIMNYELSLRTDQLSKCRQCSDYCKLQQLVL